MGRGNSSSTPQADEREVVNWNGPLKKHSCTDIICLLLFLVCLAAWGFVAFMAFKDGDISKVSLKSGYHTSFAYLTKNRSSYHSNFNKLTI